MGVMVCGPLSFLFFLRKSYLLLCFFLNNRLFKFFPKKQVGYLNFKHFQVNN